MAKKEYVRLFTVGVVTEVGGVTFPRFVNVVDFLLHKTPWNKCVLECTDKDGIQYNYTLKDNETVFVNFVNLKGDK